MHEAAGASTECALPVARELYPVLHVEPLHCLQSTHCRSGWGWSSDQQAGLYGCMGQIHPIGHNFDSPVLDCSKCNLNLSG